MRKKCELREISLMSFLKAKVGFSKIDTSVRDIKSRRIIWAGHVERMDERIGMYRVSVGKPEGKRSLGRPRLTWEDNIKMDLREVGCWGYGPDRAGSG